MSDLVIPEDLRHQHSIATVAYSVQCYTGREVVSLIERIAALEAENGRLRAPVSAEEMEGVLGGRDTWIPGDITFSIAATACANALIAARAQQPIPAQDKAKPKRRNNGQCAAQVVDCDCPWCSPAQDSALATSIAQTAEWTAQANQLTVANDEKAGEIRRLKAALNAAAMSLETVHEQAGRDIYLKHMDQVRGYARSRSLVARAALAQTEPQPEATPTP